MNTRTMSRSLFLGASVLALAAAGCGGGNNADGQAAQTISASSDAQGRAGGMRGHRGGHDPARMVQHFDRNGNGTLELAELPEGMRERMAAADTDHDGVIAATELTAMGEAQRAAHFARIDTNSDGAVTADEAGAERWTHISVADADHDNRVTRTELDAAHASGAMGRGMGGEGEGRGWRGGHGMMGRGGPPSAANMIQRFDSNGNGALEVSELPDRMRERMAAADADHNGVLAEGEITAAMEAHRAQREQGIAPAAPTAPTSLK
jgi:hypothetical protein